MPSKLPSIHTVVSQSDAPIVRKVLLLFHSGLIFISRWYHAISAASFTPDNSEPHGNGTVIWCVNETFPRFHFLAIPSLSESNSNCQTPLRFCHCALSKSGRGCSGNGIVRERTVCVMHTNAKRSSWNFFMIPRYNFKRFGNGWVERSEKLSYDYGCVNRTHTKSTSFTTMNWSARPYAILFETNCDT